MSAELAGLIALGIALVSLGLDMIRDGQVLEGCVVALVGLMVILIYHFVSLPQYVKRIYKA